MGHVFVLPVRSRPNFQIGQSLISVMVGVMLSLLTITGMLTLYKNLIQVSGNASHIALRDGQVASALLAAQVALQEAGYGIAPSDPLSTKLRIDQDRKRVIWRYKPQLTESDLCAGLLLVDAPSATAKNTQLGLYWLLPKSCVSVEGMRWSATEREPLASQDALFMAVDRKGQRPASVEAGVDALSFARLIDGVGLEFHHENKPCLPFMQQTQVTPTDRLGLSQQLTLRSPSKPPILSVCLSNLVATSDE